VTNAVAQTVVAGPYTLVRRNTHPMLPAFLKYSYLASLWLPELNSTLCCFLQLQHEHV